MVEKSTGSVPGETSDTPSPKGDAISSRLFYPDNVANRYHNGTYIVEIGSERISLEIVDGVINTDREDVCSVLVKQGFILMSKMEKSNE